MEAVDVGKGSRLFQVREKTEENGVAVSGTRYFPNDLDLEWRCFLPRGTVNDVTSVELSRVLARKEGRTPRT